MKGAEVVIDALLGVGASGEVREPVKSLVEVMNSSRAHKIAVDCPTPGFAADSTVSFHFPKTEDAEVADIGIPIEAEKFCGPGDVYLALPTRTGSEHKGDFGRVLIVGGSRDYAGAPVLAAKAALRTGADLATICTPSYVAARMPFDENLIVRPLQSEYYLQKSDVESVLSQDFDALVLGNGLSQEDETRHAVKNLLREAEKPVVVDADALKLIKPRDVKKSFVLTPHAKEFEAFFGEKPEDREEAAERCAAETESVVVLKGQIDVVSDGRETKLNRTGNPGMTVGGTGDVLAGIIGALACRSDLFQAACAGVFLSGLSGDLAYRRSGYSLLATDCIESIPSAIRFCEGFA
jgi:NAD(P)H-hydrate epimerase